MQRYIAYTKDYNYRFFDAQDLQHAELAARRIYRDNLHHVELYSPGVHRGLVWLAASAFGIGFWLWAVTYVNHLY